MHGLSNKDCKQILTMSVTCNTQEHLLTEIHRPSPQHFFIINTGIKTILDILLILLVVSTHTTSKIKKFVTIFIVPVTLLDNLK